VTDLIDYLSRLVLEQSALSLVEDSLREHPNLLTIEDFLQFPDWAQAWGFADEVIKRAGELAHHYDVFVRSPRWQR